MTDDRDDIDILTDLALRPRSRVELEAEFGEVWDGEELSLAFEVTAVIPPTYIVRRRSDGVVGTVLCQPRPLLYFHFRPAPDRP